MQYLNWERLRKNRVKVVFRHGDINSFGKNIIPYFLYMINVTDVVDIYYLNLKKKKGFERGELG